MHYVTFFFLLLSSDNIKSNGTEMWLSKKITLLHIKLKVNKNNSNLSILRKDFHITSLLEYISNLEDKLIL